MDSDEKNKLKFFSWKDKKDKDKMSFPEFATEMAADEVFLMKDTSEIVYVNHSACRELGYERDELIGKFVWEWDPLFPKEAWPGFWQEFMDKKYMCFETQHQRKNGTVFPVEIRGFLFEENEVNYALAFVNNISSQKLKENEAKEQHENLEKLVTARTSELNLKVTQLKEQEQELENIFQLSQDLLCIATLEGRFIKTSNSFTNLFGYSKEELLKIPFLDLIHPDDIESTYKEMAKLAHGEPVIDFQIRFRTKDGNYILLSWEANFSHNDNLIYASATDITHKKEVEEQMIQSKIEIEKAKAKNSFLANMSHEIRTPLNAIIGFNDLLKDTKLTNEQLRHVNIISSALNNLRTIINDILDISKLESGKFELEKRSFRIEKLLKQVIQMQSLNAKSKKLKFILSYDSEIPEFIVGDETRLTQILVNLISNAIKFTQQGQIEVHATELSKDNENVTIQFRVKDTGIGIEPSKLNLIFERFTQAEDYTTRVFGGTGLGLNIVKSLVELFNGKLDVKSTPGIGSEFSFEINFPIGDSSDDLSTMIEEKSIDLSGIRILLIEDNEHNQILAKTYLERNNAVVEIAGNGLVGIEMLRKNTYDCIFMDVQMPIMDGIQATKIIRKEVNSSIPIIGCSAHSLESERSHCIDIGMNAYITKPYSEKDLLDALEKQKIGKKPVLKKIVKSDDNNLSKEDDVLDVFKNLELDLGAEITNRLLLLFKERIPNDIYKIKNYLTDAEYSSLGSSAHNIAGSLGSLKLLQGYELAKQLETASQKEQHDLIHQYTNELLQYLNKIMLDLNRI